jgi:hypothetical protein
MHRRSDEWEALNARFEAQAAALQSLCSQLRQQEARHTKTLSLNAVYVKCVVECAES